MAGALEEVAEALAETFGIEDMESWNQRVLESLANPELKENTELAGANVMQKISRQDRLVGPASFCKDNGVLPYYLTKAAAYAFVYPSDTSGKTVQQFAGYYGMKKAIVKYCGLECEPELLQLINGQYDRITREAAEDTKKISLMKEAYQLGYESEKVYRGCGQCTLLAMYQLAGHQDDSLFRSASAFAGGMSLSGDGVCGGYSGGLMYFGSILGRRLKEMMENGDKETQFICYALAQELRDKFLETYGSVICSDIHNQIFGKPYCLRTIAVRGDFDKVGAHTSKCTAVVGMACMWVTEILYDNGYLKTQ